MNWVKKNSMKYSNCEKASNLCRFDAFLITWVRFSWIIYSINLITGVIFLGQTQNSNESLHAVVWSRCPKTIFIGKDKLEAAVCCALAVFNKGARQTTDMMREMGIEVSEMALEYSSRRDSRRIRNTIVKNEPEVKRQRKAKQTAEKKERASETSYIPGAF